MRIFTTILLLFIYINTQAQYYQNDPNLVETETGLKYKITKQGEGEYPNAGDKVWVHYYTKLTNDSLFDTSIERGPLEVYLGQGQLIKGWEEGLKLIKPGGSILLIIPPKLAYGSQEFHGLPANSTLICEINLLQVNKGKKIEPFDITNLQPKKTPEGITYYCIKQGQGENAKIEDNAYIHYSGFLPNGSIFDSSVKKGAPVHIITGINQLFEGFDIALKLMNKGSKYRFIIPHKLAYNTKGYGNAVPPNTNITLDIELVDLKTPPNVTMWKTEGKRVLTTDSGLKYAIFNAGKGELIENDDIVEVHYSGYFTNGRLFDSSVKRFEPIQFPIGIGAVIDGWDEGLKLMRKGAKFQLQIPAKLAYGEQGAPPQIPANTDLIFDIEVVDIINK